MRRGHFKRIYPTYRSCNRLGKLMDERYNNVLMHLWMNYCHVQQLKMKKMKEAQRQKGGAAAAAASKGASAQAQPKQQSGPTFQARPR